MGSIGIGHTRYPTAGSSSSSEAQPFYTNSPYGICMAHNGNLTNAEELENAMRDDNHRHINTGSDSELLLNVFADELQSRRTSERLDPERVFDAVTALHARCNGSYGTIAMVHNFGLVAFRDPNGIRPLVVGRRPSPAGADGFDYCFASESVALDILGFDLVRDVAPGECLTVSLGGELRSRQCAPAATLSPCIFEYVYFARPDSILDGISVYQARLNMGDRLARTIQRKWAAHDIDVVVPVPDTSRTSALQLSYVLGVPFREGFIKNRYVARTFIMPGQTHRAKSVRKKLNPVRLELNGKNVLLVDDSVVRGTTSRKIIQLAREAGARRVYFSSAAPPIRFPNVYGIDMPSPLELIAHGRSEEDVCALLGADRFFYQELPDLVDAVRSLNPLVSRFDASCFDGCYVTGVDPDFIARNSVARSDAYLKSKAHHLLDVAVPPPAGTLLRETPPSMTVPMSSPVEADDASAPRHALRPGIAWAGPRDGIAVALPAVAAHPAAESSSTGAAAGRGTDAGTTQGGESADAAPPGADDELALFNED